MIVFLSGCLAILSLVYYYIQHKMNYWKDAGVPCVKPQFPFGNLKGMGTKFHLSQLMSGFYKELKGKGPFGGIYFFTNPTALITDLDLIKKILIKDFNNFSDRGVYYNEKDDPLSAHLFSIEGAKWKSLREKMTPTFTSGKMKMMFPTIVDVGTKFKETLERESIDNEVEIKDILARFTTDVIGSCAFGIECDSLNNPHTEFREFGKKIFNRPASAILKAFFTTAFGNLSRFLHLKNIPVDVAAFFMNIVKQTVAYREENNIARNDFMNLMIQIKNKGQLEGDKGFVKTGNLTVEEIAAQAFVVFLAGFETSSTAMNFCLYELALNQKLQDKARESIKQVLAKHDGKLTYEATLDMKYIDQCINESLRKYSPVTNLMRKTNNDYQVEGTDFTFKKGQTILIPVSAIQHDPEYYPDPETYDPDRFSPELSASRNPFTFLPFGDGPRVCIGLRFGMMQARIGLITVLSNFKIEIASRTDVPLIMSEKDFIITPKNGVWLKFKKI